MTKKDPFAKIAGFMNDQVIRSWKNTLDGFRDETLFVPQHKEAYHGAMNDETILKLIAQFEGKYNKKLKYRQLPDKLLYYISYVETEVGPEYDRTVLNSHMESYTAFKRDQELNKLV